MDVVGEVLQLETVDLVLVGVLRDSSDGSVGSLHGKESKSSLGYFKNIIF